MARSLKQWLGRMGLSLAISLGLALPGLAAERIVSTDAAATQIIFALAMDSALVGIDVTSKLPADYRELPSLGYHRALSPEGLLALEPSLVIGSEHIGPPNVLTTLDAAEVRVLQLPTANSVDGIRDNIRRVAEATGSQDKASLVLAQLDGDAAALVGNHLAAERIAFVLSVEPGKLRIAGRGTAGAAFIDLLGGANIADFDAYRTLSAEAVLQMDPTLVLVANHEDASPGRLLELNPILEHGSAAANNRILAVDAAKLVTGLSPGAVADAARLATELRGELAAN
jgi:iron complex transport system substrate-binding protein